MGETQNVMGAITDEFICLPDEQVGSIRVYGKTELIISAHNHPLKDFTITGCSLATVSEFGTLVRIFDLQTGEIIKTYRLSYSPLKVNRILFSPKSKWLAVLTDKGFYFLNMLR